MLSGRLGSVFHGIMVLGIWFNMHAVCTGGCSSKPAFQGGSQKEFVFLDKDTKRKLQ